MVSDKTIQFTIAKPPNKPKPFIYIWDGTTKTLVYRLSWRGRMGCRHEWFPVSNPGHGNWRSGCIYCGALAR